MSAIHREVHKGTKVRKLGKNTNNPREKQDLRKHPVEEHRRGRVPTKIITGIWDIGKKTECAIL